MTTTIHASARDKDRMTKNERRHARFVELGDDGEAALAELDRIKCRRVAARAVRMGLGGYAKALRGFADAEDAADRAYCRANDAVERLVRSLGGRGPK